MPSEIGLWGQIAQPQVIDKADPNLHVSTATGKQRSVGRHGRHGILQWTAPASRIAGTLVAGGGANKRCLLSNLASSRRIGAGGLALLLAIQPVGAPAALSSVDGFWDNTAQPQLLVDPDRNAVELGLKFRASTNGFVSGIQFCKTADNTEVHDVHFCISSGQLQAKATLLKTTQTGWLTVSSSVPVEIHANTSYISSYYVPSASGNYFTSSLSNGALYTPNDAKRYSYGPNRTFPNSTWHSRNYLVDIVSAQNATSSSPPTAGNDSAVTNQDVALRLTSATLLANDRDPDGDPLKITSAGNASKGVVTLDAHTGDVVFTPTAGYSGPVSFTYTISDGKGCSATATVSLSVVPINHPPVANADSGFSTLLNTPLTIQSATLLASDTDPDGDMLKVAAVGNPAHGSVTLNAQTTAIIFTPITGYSGPGSFTYTVTDGNGGSSTATVNLTVNTSGGGSAGAGAAAGNITTVHLRAASGNLMPGEVTSFGQAFAPGDVPSGAGVVGAVNGQTVPLQMDIKATHADGSVRHALLTLAVPQTVTASNLDVTLARSAAPTRATTTAAQVAQDLLTRGYDLKVEVTTQDGQLHVTDAAAALSQAIAKGLDVWMNGPFATEFRVNAPITTDLLGQFDIRAYSNGAVRTDVTIANDWINSKNGALTQPDNITYNVDVKENGRTTLSYNLVHHKNADWHHQVWSHITPPAIHVTRDIDYLERTGAVPAFDTSIKVDEATLKNDWTALQQADTRPMGPALVTTYMPTTGGRPDIGELPAWQVLYLLSQDPRAEAVMLANADAAGSIPWHLRDAATGLPITIDNHPGISTIWGNGSGADRFTEAYDTGDTRWTPDNAHFPALSYLPYLLTGDRYYLDQLQAEANWPMLNQGASYRQMAKGLFEAANEQVRGQAWGMRSLGYAAYVTPDSDPLKAYFAGKLDNNLKYYVDKFVTQRTYTAAGQVEGYQYRVDDRTPGVIAPWQDDYFALAMSQLSTMQFTAATDLLKWKANFTTGRFISAALGFNPFHGTDYLIGIYDGATGRLYSTWREINDATQALTRGGTPTELSMNYVGGSADNARAALAGMITATQDPRAIEAYGFVVAETEGVFASGHTDNPTWAVAPRLADGSIIQHSGIQVRGSANDTFTGGAGSQLLHGRGGNDVIDGGPDADLIFGGDGDDRVNGNEGDDSVFGGKGNDTVDGGRGNDYVKGNEGADLFVFAGAGSGVDTIADFRIREDHVTITDISQAQGQAVAASATADANGNAVLHLTATDTVTLLRITPAQLRDPSVWLR